MTASGSASKAGEVWERLSFYESTDFVSKSYRERHKEEVVASKAHEITSHLKQGREYFESAGAAGDLARPLLLYYGSLALARGLVLFLSPDKREMNLKRGHGLTAKGWEATLVGGIAGVPDLTISATEGTFRELADATSNAERIRIDLAPYPNKVGFKTQGTVVVPPGTSLTLREALARIPELYRHFQRTFARTPRCYPAFVFMLSPETQTDIYLLDLHGNLPDDAEIRGTLQLGDSLVLARAKEHPLLGPIPNASFRLTHRSVGEFFAQAPPIVTDQDGAAFVRGPLDKGLRFSSLSYFIIVAFAMGMLVRYYPTVWADLVTGAKGDYTLPILKAAASLVEERLPYLALLELEDPTGWPEQEE